MSEATKEVVATGSWLYDGLIRRQVFIIRTNFDFWHEVAKGEDALTPDEKPDLSDDGFAYYVSFREIADDGSFWPHSGGYRSPAEAKAAARLSVPTEIEWSDGV